MPTLFMETTEISAEKTIAEIESYLISHGANAVLKEYSAGSIEAVSFKMNIPGGDIPFRLPCRWQAICQVFRKRANISDYYWTYASTQHIERRRKIEEKAKRVAWRQILRWIQAQMALVDTNMVKVQEVFFPYIQAPSGQTLYELNEAKNFGLLLGPAEVP